MNYRDEKVGYITFGPGAGTDIQRCERNGVSHQEIEERFFEKLKERDEQIRKQAIADYKASRGVRA